MLLRRDAVLEALALTNGHNGLVALVALIEGVARHGLPMVETALGEGLSAGVGTETGGESEGLHDGEVGKQSHLGRAGALLLREDVATTLSEDTVHVAHGVLGDGNVAQVHGLEEAGLGVEHGGEAYTASGGHDLSHTTVDGISVENDIHEVETAATHLLLGKRTVLGSPGKATYDGLLDFKQVVDSLGGVNKQVGAGSLGTEGPDLTGLGDIPAVIISEQTALDLGISSGLYLTIINGETELGTKGLGVNEETVVLVGRLGEAGLAGLGLAGLTEGDNGVRDLHLGSHEIVLKILEANLKVKLAGRGDDVLAGLFGVAQNHGI